MLNLKRLHLLRELSVLGTISAVAEAQGLTRPAVSAQLALLEKECKARLFERGGRGIVLTPVGERLANRADTLLQLAVDMQSELEAAGAEIAGEVRVSAFGSIAAGLLPSVFTMAATRFPRLDLTFEEIESAGGLKAVVSRKIDMAVIDEWVDVEPYAPQLELQLLGVDQFVAVVPADHPTVSRRKKHIALGDLANDRWTINKAAPAYRVALLRACYSAGFQPRETSSCRNMLATLALIRDAGLVSVLPAIGFREVGRIPGLHIAPLDPPVTRNILLATAKGASTRPTVQATIKLFREAMATEAPSLRNRSKLV